MSARKADDACRKAELDQLDDIALAKLVREREHEPAINVRPDELLVPEEISSGSGMKVGEHRAEYKVNSDVDKNVGWVPPSGDKRPEAVTHQTETVGYAALTHPTVPDWRTVRLSEVCEKITDGTHHSPPNGPVGDFKYITAKNIKPWGLDLTDVTYIDAATHREIYARCNVRKNDVLYVKDGATAGRLALNTLDEEFSLLSSVGVLRPGPQVRPKYLAYALQSPLVKDRMLAGVAGVAITRLTLKKLKEAEIPLAPLDLQDSIVAEIEKQFSRLDEAVANLKRVKANLKRYKAAVLKAAVEGRLVETEAERARREGRSFETGAQLLQRILETRRSQWKGKGKYKEPAAPNTTDLSELPEGWVWSNFESAAERVTVGHVGSMKDEYVADGVPFLRSQNVRPNRYDSEGLKFISQAFHLQLGKSALKPGDIAVVRSGSVGVSCVIPDALSEANCSDLVIIRSPQAVLPDFGAYYMNSVVETRVAAGKVGIALTHFNTQSVAMLPLPVPPMAEQHRIVAEVDRRLSLVRANEAQVEANLQRAESLRQSILATAYAGG